MNSEEKQRTQYTYAPCSIEHNFVDDVAGGLACSMTLEQQKQCEAENERKVQVQRQKAEILEIITKLKNDFAAIKDQNCKLPPKFRLEMDAFEIDKRITNDLEQRTEEKFQIIQSELQKKINKMRKQAERMENLYLNRLEHWPVAITGFR